MGKFVDLTGQRFGRLIVIERADDYISPSGYKYVMWHCRCNCGNEIDVKTSSLNNGNTKSCGCLARETNSKNHQVDLTGQVFGRWTVIEKADNLHQDAKYTIKWKCLCECGQIGYKSTNVLRSGHSKSCGCYKKDLFNERNTPEDLTNRRFGKLTVIKRIDDYISPKGEHKINWLCKCDCGNVIHTTTNALKKGNTASCGCQRADTIHKVLFQDLTGKRFGKLTVIHQVEDYHSSNGNSKSSRWLCKCDCGNETIVNTGILNLGMVKSCGCMRSSGEYNIIQYFLLYNIKFEHEKRFDNLIGVGNRQLSYDFYLPNRNLLIECQGQQHEKPIEIFGGEEQFKIQQEHDKRKREYAENNGYKLLEIWYYDYDRIEEILSRELELD